MKGLHIQPGGRTGGSDQTRFNVYFDDLLIGCVEQREVHYDKKPEWRWFYSCSCHAEFWATKEFKQRLEAAEALLDHFVASPGVVVPEGAR